MNIVFFALLAALRPAASIDVTPIERVVQLIGDLKQKAMNDGKNEQAAFDGYACWCEKTMERKAADIGAAKELIGETEILIEKLKGEIASHGAEISQLGKDIVANLASQKDATSMRNKEYNEYADEKSESEQCIGAMEAAIKVLTGAGTKGGFLDTSTHAAQLLSVAASVRTIFSKKALLHAVSAKDLDLVKSFVAQPEDFMKTHSKPLIAAQVGQNPFGDYAPQSSQIQGILKGMYDSFTGDLEKANAAEAESQKSFEALIATKKEEQSTLESTKQKQETDQAAKTKHLKESQVLKDDTAAQLAADEAFFADTKDACKDKATQWSIRTRLRTEELAGMNEAMTILSSGKATFAASSNTFLQLASVQKHQVSAAGSAKAYAALRKLATEFKSFKLARIAAAVQIGGHFDKVMVLIDDMMALLRKEEASDVVHRDLCENSQNANKNEMADLDSMIERSNKMLKRMDNTKGELLQEIQKLKDDIQATRDNQGELLKFRNKESADFSQALKDDTDAVALIQQAIVALSKFYKNNKLSVGLVQAPEYEKDADKPPAVFEDANYGGRKSESGGILAILGMLSEDLEKEIADGRADDADAEDKYQKQNGALQSTLDAQDATKVGLEEELASTEEKIDATKDFRKGKTDDQSAEGDTKKALATDCKWVKTHFQTRRDKRKTEMQGLVDAKAFLAGVDAGEEPLPLN